MLTRTFGYCALLLIVIGGGIMCAGCVFGADEAKDNNITITVTDATPGVQVQKKSKLPAADLPREMSMRPLPAYRIEPPDIIQVEMLKMVPHTPYHISVFDVLQIRVVGTNTDQPIDNFYLVEGGGIVDMGPSYGKLRVEGMTVDEAQAAILRKLQEILKEPKVSVQLSRTAGTQPVTGQYLVGPDGMINLRQYGTIQVMDMTIAEVKAALDKHLAKYFDSPDVTINMLSYNSKVFYVIVDGAGMGDNVRRIPISGNEKVLDAIASVGGRSHLSSKKMWIARPSPSDPENGTVLPIDYNAIIMRGATATNYQIMPGDRIFIAEDGAIALNNTLRKYTAPVERVLGVIGLGASTIESVKRTMQQQEDH